MQPTEPLPGEQDFGSPSRRGRKKGVPGVGGKSLRVFIVSVRNVTYWAITGVTRSWEPIKTGMQERRPRGWEKKASGVP